MVTLAILQPIYRDIEVMLFNTCNYHCAYCGFVTSGTVGYTADLEPFRDRRYVDAVLAFFDKYSSATERWTVLFSGGEPLLTPNLEYLSGELVKAGHRIRYNTNLSVPIERDEGWLAANPPEAVDVLMVSMHPEGLDEYDVLRDRIAALKALGYRIVARMVAHPQLLAWFDRVDADMASLGLSFTPIPMFSNRYPRAYTAAEKEKIAKHTKSFANLIQLNGGLDTEGRLCHAGSRLFALGLGLTGKGNLYRCVSCSPRGYLGNIFTDADIPFLTSPAPCCQQTRHCTCAFHFESNAVIGAEDGDNYERLKAGVAANVSEAFADLVRRNDLRFKYHETVPQGTEIGEQALVYRPEAALDLTLGGDRRTAFELNVDNIDRASPFKEPVDVGAADGRIHVVAPGAAGGGIRCDVRVDTAVKTCVTFEGRVLLGTTVIAVYSGDRAHLWHAIPKSTGHRVVTEPFVPEGEWITVYVYADEPVRFEVSRLTVVQVSASISASATMSRSCAS